MGITTTGPPALPGWATAELPAFMPAKPAPVRVTANGVTVEAVAGDYSGSMGDMSVTVCCTAHVRHIGGLVTVRGAGHYLGGPLYLRAGGAAVNRLALSRLEWRQQPASRSAYANRLPVMKAARKKLAAVATALADACDAAGFGAAASAYEDAGAHRLALAQELDRHTRGCRCQVGQYELLCAGDTGAHDAAHWGCQLSVGGVVIPSAAEQLRVTAVGLVPYRYEDGTPERDVAKALDAYMWA